MNGGDVMNYFIGPLSLVLVVCGFGFLLWRFGIEGCGAAIDRFNRRLVHGPSRIGEPKPDYAEIDRLERELFGE